jgi:hypothetical protein
MRRVANLCIAPFPLRVPLDKSEGVVKDKNLLAVF